jgi:3-oxoacyl-[acyl-carrier-protein] synthase-3
MAQISKIEYYLPEQIVTNQDLESENINWDLAKFEKRVGIKQRHIAAENETSLDMAVKASEKVLLDYDKSKIDYIMLCTQSPDFYLPTSACILQDRLKLNKNIGAHDFNLGCSGYIYGLAMAKGLIKAGVANNILFVTSETYSKFIHPEDKTNRAIFGDGAAATIIENSDREKIMGFEMGTDGSGFDKLIVKNGCFRNKFNEEAETFEYGTNNITSDNHLYMDGPAIFNFSIETVPLIINNLLKKEKLAIEDMDYFIYHQANKYMLNYIRKKQKISEEKFYLEIEDTGNTVSSTIPIAIKKALKAGKIKVGNKVLLAGFGVGLSYAAAIIEF